MEKKLEEVINRLDALKREVAELEAIVAELTAVHDEEPVDLSEPIDISLDDSVLPAEPDVELVAEPVVEPVAEPVAEPEVVPEEEPAVDLTVEPEDIPVEETVEAPVAEAEPAVEPEVIPAEEIVEAPAEDLPEGNFGLFGEEIPEEPRKGRRRRDSIGEAVEGGSGKAVVDAMAVGAAWRTDIPGPEVKSLRSAIALGDQVLFISRLFRKDSALYQDTVDRLNRTGTLREAIAYLSETFPEWDLASDDVYKFMMAVRRKIRK